MTDNTNQLLPPIGANLAPDDEAPASAGCGCGGCGCSGSAESAPAEPEASVQTEPADQTDRVYSVTGMTCGHCTSAVTAELTAVPGVTDVRVDLVAGGTSSVKVTSSHPLTDDVVAAALDEAGDYRLL